MRYNDPKGFDAERRNCVIRWNFDFEWLDDTMTHMEELAYQRWEGQKITQDQFFYDPAQMEAKAKE